tara:strand:+ start:850 stop:1443 length:594 start_codon:yes stop_codon:yes gene_type:complete
MTKKNLNPFDLNRTEYAELLGITPNAVRMRLRHGKLEGEYIFENGKYIFKAPSRERANQGLTTGQKTTLKKIYNRGNHFKANYPNEAFRKHNEAKMLAKLKHNVDEDIQALLPDAIEIAKGKKREILNEASGQVPVSGGQSPRSINRSSFNMGGIYHVGSNKGYGSPGYLGNTYNDTRSYEPTNRGRNINKKGPYEI